MTEYLNRKGVESSAIGTLFLTTRAQRARDLTRQPVCRDRRRTRALSRPVHQPVDPGGGWEKQDPRLPAPTFTTNIADRRAVAEGSADMTRANRSPTEQTTRGLRDQSVLTPAQAARQCHQAAVLGPAAAGHRRFRSKASDWNLGFRGGALHSCSASSAVNPGEVKWEMSV